MQETALILTAILCLIGLASMAGFVGGYLFLTGSFDGQRPIIDDITSFFTGEEPAPRTVEPKASALKQSTDSSAPSLPADSLSSAGLSYSGPLDLPKRPSQGDLSLDDFFADFSLDVANMSGDLPPTVDAANSYLADEKESSVSYRKTEPAAPSDGSKAPEGA